MGCLIDDLLAFSRSRRTEMSRSTVDQDELVASVIRNGAYDHRTPAIEWKIAELPPVTADAAMLRQVWYNLIENAAKYSGKREFPCIEIGHHWDEARQECVFFVRDNGVGFDMAYVEKLFGVFQRLHSQDEFEGTGIGLANVRQIVARHGGRTWAEGRVDAGATVYFSLPGESVSKAWRAPEKQAQAV
jgi:light-regulated signal transduction histidine kinase (bacteriophytochrome)